MKYFLRIWAAITLISVVVLSFAAGTTAHLSWTPPTAYNDGNALPATDIDHYTLTWQPAAGQSGPSGSVNVPAPAVATTASVPCGSTSFVMSVTTTATARYPNATSGPTSPVPYVTGIACTPNPPAGLAAQ